MPRASTREKQTKQAKKLHSWILRAQTQKQVQNQMAASTYFLIAFLALVTSQAIASDPSPLQDFCVADIDSPGMHALTLNNALYSCNKLQIKFEIFVRTDTVFLCLF